MRNSKINVALWTVQWFLGLFFVLASGLPKFIIPFLAADAFPLPLPLPLWFLLIIGILEISGGLGMVLPGIFRIRTDLTPLAAVGLMLITEGATVYHIAAGTFDSAVFAVVMGLIAAVVAYGRWRVAPMTTRQAPAPVFGAAR